MQKDDLNRLAVRLCLAFLEGDIAEWDEDIVAAAARVSSEEAWAAIQWMGEAPRRWCQVGLERHVAFNAAHVGAMRQYLRPQDKQQALRVVAHAILWGEGENDDTLVGLVRRSALHESVVVGALDDLKERARSRWMSLDGSGTRLLFQQDDIRYLHSFVYASYMHEMPAIPADGATIVTVHNSGQMGGVAGRGNVGSTEITTVTYRHLLQELATQLEKPDAPEGGAAIAKGIRDTMVKHSTTKAMDAAIQAIPSLLQALSSTF